MMPVDAHGSLCVAVAAERESRAGLPHTGRRYFACGQFCSQAPIEPATVPAMSVIFSSLCLF